MAALVNCNGVKLATFNGGQTRAKLSTVLSYTKQDFDEIELVADGDNTGIVHLGPVTVADVGTDSCLALKSGQSLRIAPGHPFVFNLEAIYAVGSAASQKLYVKIVRAAGRILPRTR